MKGIRKQPYIDQITASAESIPYGTGQKILPSGAERTTNFFSKRDQDTGLIQTWKKERLGQGQPFWFVQVDIKGFGTTDVQARYMHYIEPAHEGAEVVANPYFEAEIASMGLLRLRRIADHLEEVATQVEPLRRPIAS